MKTNTFHVETVCNPVGQIVTDGDLGSKIGSGETCQRTAQCIDRISRSFNDAFDRLGDQSLVDDNQKTLLLTKAYYYAQELLSRTDTKSRNIINTIEEQVVREYNFDRSQTDLIKFVIEQYIALFFFSKSLQ